MLNVNKLCSVNRKCALLEAARQCHYRMRLGDQDQWHCISQICRNRVSRTDHQGQTIFGQVASASRGQGVLHI
jgi:hypothetical protein